eukprot:m.444020 g.444020  ORF g.444020 m.444020 type:complete len:91 (+) comp56828_c0_seq7:1885-2157(+)
MELCIPLPGTMHNPCWRAARMMALRGHGMTLQDEGAPTTIILFLFGADFPEKQSACTVMNVDLGVHCSRSKESHPSVLGRLRRTNRALHG